jgi:hypothetical protein
MQLEIGMSKGETELETMTRFVRPERLHTADVIEKAVAAALEREHGKKARVLEWRLPLRSQGPF